LLYRWKKELAVDISATPTLLPVAVTPAAAEDDDEEPEPVENDGPAYMVEIELGNGRTLRVPQQIDASVLTRLINALEG
jgi:hypothetical protein